MKKVYFLFFSLIILTLDVFSQSDTCFVYPNLIPYFVDGKYGYVNSKKVIQISPIYESAEPFLRDLDIINYTNDKIRNFGEENYATVVLKNKKYRIDYKGNIVYEYKDEDFIFTEPAPIDVSDRIVYSYSYSDNGKVGVKKGDEILIKTEYEDVYCFRFDGYPPYIAKNNNNKYGLINEFNKVIIPFEYDSYDFSGNLESLKYRWNLIPLIKFYKGDVFVYIDACGYVYKK